MRFFFFLLLLIISFTLPAATVTWVGPTTGLFSIGSNWSTGTAPGPFDDVIIPGGTSPSMAINVSHLGVYQIGSLSTSGHVNFNFIGSGYTFIASNGTMRSSLSDNTIMNIPANVDFQVGSGTMMAGLDLLGTINVAPGGKLTLLESIDFPHFIGPEGLLKNEGELNIVFSGTELENRGGRIENDFPSSSITGTGIIDLVASAGASYQLGGTIAASPITFQATALAPGVPVFFAANTIIPAEITPLNQFTQIRVIGRGAGFASGAAFNLTVNYTGFSGTDTYKFIDTDGPLTPPSYGLPAADPGRVWNDISTSEDVVLENTVLLPVDLGRFVGVTRNKVNHLSWETYSEMDNAGFAVQRSQDGGQWETLGFVAAHGAAAVYDFIDTAPFTGNNFYRLKQEDFDGTTALSGVIQLNLAPAPLAIGAPSVFPNPVRNHLTLRNFSGAIRLVSFMGNTLQTVPTGTMDLDVSNLPAGQYVLIGEAGERVRFVRQ